MDHIPRRQIKPRCDHSLAGSDGGEPVARLLHPAGPGRPENGAAHATSHQQIGICGVGKRIHLHIGDIVMHYGKRHGPLLTSLFFRAIHMARVHTARVLAVRA